MQSNYFPTVVLMTLFLSSMLFSATIPTPVSALTDENSGCWVMIFEDDDFEDDWDIIYGPGEWNDMRDLPNADKDDWGDEIDSLIVGPNAGVFVYEDEGFEDRRLYFGPDREVDELDDYGMGDEIDSLKIILR